MLIILHARKFQNGEFAKCVTEIKNYNSNSKLKQQKKKSKLNASQLIIRSDHNHCTSNESVKFEYRQLI